ncbi:EAL domain-containing protein [Butyrivibrio sp. YAB3001]|uniref:EAL domain-containing protein n=1 Tax=Butyrivibrio sp. YAB3001 TaxID=1520812 RepID=UPI0008F61CD5|nr:EAL domain-containing protein [Butyrivibrio sp. YAB3001]SFC26270.1 EAL domain, c-di-GMP-specific phosphodiesterase class I (or its enzymatically inactive variant) [Butyrivibrio sp. YAB3001]
MWNYSFVFPSLLVLGVFVGYYFSLPRVPLRMNRTFIHLIIIECSVMILDIVSSAADSSHQDFSLFTLYVVNSAYFIAFFARAYYFFIFTASALRLNFLNSKTKRYIIAMPFAISIVIVLTTSFTRWFYYMDEEGYHSAPLYNLLYFVFWLYLCLSFYGVFTRKEDLRIKSEYHILFWYNVILLGGTIVRLLFPKYLLMDTFCLLALITIYLSFENPDFYMEGRTWLFNNRALLEYLEEINDRKKFTLFAFTIHNYNELKELYGSRQMDIGNYKIGEYLRKEFKKKKIFYNRDGRFVILYEEKCDKDEINRKLQERFRNPWVAEDAEFYFDIGCAYLDSSVAKIPFSVLSQLLTIASIEADRADRNEVKEIGAEHATKARKEMEVKRAMAYALDQNLVEVFLQPIMDARTGKLAGAEALARIRDSEGKIIPPDLFIPIAEQNGRINEMGHQVFVKVCKFIKDNDLDKMGMSWINVNLSPIQFMRADLGEILMKSMTEYEIDPKYIHLEITEEHMVDDQLLVNQANTIRQLGFQLVLDDYGKGYSNMTRVKQCPFICIKLDMSIVWDYIKKPDEMLPSMVKTFSSMGFEITAEGIEDENMARQMREIGCKYLQGFYYARALPMDEFLERYVVK